MSLMQRIREYNVPAGSMAFWWLGQSGYIFKSPAGTTFGVDLYLTDSCAGLHPEVNLKRQIPVLIEPEDLEVDLFSAHTITRTTRIPKPFANFTERIHFLWRTDAEL